ncbi:MAG: hypothetical protein U9R64_15025 [Pseudomonadota bacterium]|nr:hypothetical protein [Pseudomonadota bacterium]
MALGLTEVLLIIGAIALMFGAPSLLKWAKALREAKYEFERPMGPYDKADAVAKVIEKNVEPKKATVDKKEVIIDTEVQEAK